MRARALAILTSLRRQRGPTSTVRCAAPRLCASRGVQAPNGANIEAGAVAGTERNGPAVRRAGPSRRRADPEIDGAAVVPTFVNIAAANTVVNLGTHPSAGRPAARGRGRAITWLTAKLGEGFSSADYVRATQTAHRLGRQMAAFHSQWDVLLTPGLATQPVKLGWIDMMMEDVHEYWRRVFAFSPFTVWFNLTGQPAMMLPLARGAEGMPLAVQLVGRYGDEATLFQPRSAARDSATVVRSQTRTVKENSSAGSYNFGSAE